MYHSFSYFPLLPPPPLNFISSLFLFPPFPSSLAPSLSFLSPHPPHYLSPTLPPPSLFKPHHQSQGATQLGSLTSKLALFAGFSTRNFFNKFSQSAVKEQTQHSHWTHVWTPEQQSGCTLNFRLTNITELITHTDIVWLIAPKTHTHKLHTGMV